MRRAAVATYAQRLQAAERDRALLASELSEARALCARSRAELELDLSTAPASKVRAAYKRLRRTSTTLLAMSERLLGGALTRLDEQLSVLATEQASLRDDLLERYYELMHIQSPRFAENVFMYGGDEIPTSAAGAAAAASVASVFLPLSTEARARPGVKRKRAGGV